MKIVSDVDDVKYFMGKAQELIQLSKTVRTKSVADGYLKEAIQILILARLECCSE